MDREEAIETLKKVSEHVKHDEYGISFSHEWVGAYEMALAALREQASLENEKQASEQKQASKWISVSERLPEPFVSVLGYCPDEEPLPTVHECYVNGFGQWTSSVVYGMGTVTHWMEMPEPPED